jgi:hypothetical protein
MRHALARNVVELPMQRDRIGCGQRAIDGAPWRDQTDGADAGRDMAELLPDLPREGGDRGLAAGAGDADDRRGLLGIEFRRGKRQRTARIGGRDERRAASAPRRVFAGDGDRARGNGGVDETRPVGPEAGECKEEIAGSTARPVTTVASACASTLASSLKRSRSFISFQSADVLSCALLSCA